MRGKVRRIWKIIRDLPNKGKLGVFLWLIGYPIGFAGVLLVARGDYQFGAILLMIPIFEGNLGMILAGKEVFSSIRKEFFWRKSGK